MSEISVLFTEKEIADAVAETGRQLTEQYKGKKLLVITVLKGAYIFASDLVRHIDADIQMAFVRAKSYEGTESTGEVHISNTSDFDGLDLNEWNILLVEDILDTGRTLNALKEYFKKRTSQNVIVSVLLDKPSRRLNDLKPDYSCFEIEDKFVVGYGLDYDEKYRQLPYVGEITF